MTYARRSSKYVLPLDGDKGSKADLEVPGVALYFVSRREMFVNGILCTDLRFRMEDRQE